MQKPPICSKCQSNFSPIFQRFRLGDISGLAIFDYDQTIRQNLYQYKGCFDLEIANIFLLPWSRYLHFKYRNFVLVPAPSTAESETLRGFNHVQQMFACLRLPFVHAFIKIGVNKQAGANYTKRQEIEKHIVLNEPKNLIGKNILLVDDVMTTGATLKAMAKHLRSLPIGRIEILVMSKTSILTSNNKRNPN